MDLIGILTLIQTIATVLSLLVTIFVASKVIKIETQIKNNVTVDGNSNIVAGRDADVKR